MLANVFLKSLRDQGRALLGWGAGVVLLVVAMAAFWPSVRDMQGVEEFLAQYPEAMREIFNLEALTTGAGFFNAELFSIMLPALFIVFAVGRGARLVAGEEDTGTLEVLLVTPVSRVRVLLHKAAALAVCTSVLGIALFAAVAVSATVADMGIGIGHAAVASLAMVLLGIEHGWLALAVGAITGRRSLAVGTAAAVATAGYVLYVMGSLVDALEPWQPISPFAQALEGGPLGTSLPAAYLWMVLAAVIFLAAALPVFNRRDIAIA